MPARKTKSKKRSIEKSGLDEVWSTGNHGSGLYQADVFEFLGALEDESVDCVWTDPPYLLSNDGVTCVAGKRAKVNKGEWDRSHGITRDHQFNLAWLSECKRILKPGGSIWVSGTHHVYLSVGMAMLELNFRILNDIIWEKTNPPPNLGCRCFTHASEMILWATTAQKGSKARHVFNYKEMRQENGGKQMKSVWRFGAASKREKTLGKHPTQKPLELVARCLRACTKRGELVVDPFAGSSTTGLAAIQMGRRYLGCDNDPRSIAISRKRLEALIDTAPLLLG